MSFIEKLVLHGNRLAQYKQIGKIFSFFVLLFLKSQRKSKNLFNMSDLSWFLNLQKFTQKAIRKNVTEVSRF